MAPPPPCNVLLIIYDGINTLDVNGPLEVLRRSGRSTIFKVTIACEKETAESVEGAIMKAPKCLDDDLINELDDYDVLVIPGGFANGADSPIQKLANDPSRPFNRLIAAFAKLSPRKELHQRILLSICTGATFPSKLGIFNNARYCTTHWSFYKDIVNFNAEAAAVASQQSGDEVKPGVVLPARFVDSGLNEHGVRIISSGGISCGMDAALHIVVKWAGWVEAKETAELLDYRWQKTQGVEFGVVDWDKYAAGNYS